jgi:signal transduction histidine kinase
LIIAKNITHIRELEKTKAHDRMKMLFYTSTTHELRTPLNGMIGVHEMLESFIVSP